MDSPCDGCFVRRVKCDRRRPCETCRTRSHKCTYVRVRKRPGPKGPRAATSRKIEEVQRQGTVPSEMAHSHSIPPSCSLDLLPLSPCAPHSRIPVTTYCTILDVFERQLYAIWPIIDVPALKGQLQGRVDDPTSLALAAAACAATLAQMRLWITPNPWLDDLAVTADDFTKECLRTRLEQNYHQEPSLQALVTSIFLHMFYANRDQITPATISLREAITYADLMRLSHTPPADAQSKQWQLELRCYWILFVTERSARPWKAWNRHRPIFIPCSSLLQNVLHSA